jgi:hypothetical protein
MKISANKTRTLSFAALVLGAQALDAISFRHDVLEQEYIDLSAPYNSVGRAQGNGQIGTGFLASPTKFVTAAHLVDSDRDGVADTQSFTARFGNTTSGFDNTFSASSVDVHPLYTSSKRYDIAVFTFDTAITGYSPMAISEVDPFGQIATMVGYGLHGDGDTFGSNNSVDNTRRAAQNIIDSENSSFYLTDFDRVTEDTSSYGTAVPLSLEGTSAGGDSGGPLIVDGAVVGIVQGGLSNLFGGFSEYGDRATWVKLNDPDNISYLESHGLSPVPEPSIFALALTSLLVFGRRRRK